MHGVAGPGHDAGDATIGGVASVLGDDAVASGLLQQVAFGVKGSDHERQEWWEVRR